MPAAAKSRAIAYRNRPYRLLPPLPPPFYRPCLGRPLAALRRQWYYIRVIADFADQGTEDIFYGVNSAAARRACPAPLHPSAWKKLERVNAVGELADLAWPPGNRLEPLRGDRRGQPSIRINDQYRFALSGTALTPGRWKSWIITADHPAIPLIQEDPLCLCLFRPTGSRPIRG